LLPYFFTLDSSSRSTWGRCKQVHSFDTFRPRWWRGSKNFFFPRIGQITGPGERTERSRWSMIWHHSHQSFYWSKEIRGGKIQIRGRVCVCTRENDKRNVVLLCVQQLDNSSSSRPSKRH
jgi:hypothetical protein